MFSLIRMVLLLDSYREPVTDHYSAKRCHRDILVFASPFFESALSGDWSETRVDAGSVLSQSIADTDAENADADYDAEEADDTLAFPGSGFVPGWGTNSIPGVAAFSQATTGATVGVEGRRQSRSSVITIPQPPADPRDRTSRDQPSGVICAPASSPDSERGEDSSSSSNNSGSSGSSSSSTADGDGGGSGRDEDADIVDLHPEIEALDLTAVDSSASEAGRTGDARRKRRLRKRANRDESLSQLEARSSGEGAVGLAAAAAASATGQKRQKGARKNGKNKDATRLPPAEAKIVLKEEKASTFHDFLKFVYPQ